jgi:serine O-acetyltransferase
MAADDQQRIRAFRKLIRARHPGFVKAVLADTRITSEHRGLPLAGCSRGRVMLEALRLGWQSDGFLAQTMYRAKARLQGLGVPILPRLFHRLAIATSGIYIGDPVIVHPGVHLAHGEIVIDGIVEVHEGATIFPFVTIGLREGSRVGPTIGTQATIGTGAKVIGDVRVGERARIGANSVVIDDVPDGATVVGIPARAAGDAVDGNLTP